MQYLCEVVCQHWIFVTTFDAKFAFVDSNLDKNNWSRCVSIFLWKSCVRYSSYLCKLYYIGITHSPKYYIPVILRNLSAKFMWYVITNSYDLRFRHTIGVHILFWWYLVNDYPSKLHLWSGVSSYVHMWCMWCIYPCS